MRRGNEGTEIQSKTFNNCHDVLGFEITHAPLWRITRYPLYDEPTPVRWHIKGFTTHGARGIWARTARFPTIEAPSVKLVTTTEFTSCALAAHTRQAY